MLTIHGAPKGRAACCPQGAGEAGQAPTGSDASFPCERAWLDRCRNHPAAQARWLREG